jgi:hypothetical protein
VSVTGSICLVQAELAEQKVALALNRRSVTEARHRGTSAVHVIAPDQQVRIEARPRRRTAVGTIGERRSFQKDRIDVCRRQRSQDGDNLRAPQ